MDDDYVVRANIKRFEQLLEEEQDPGRRATLSALLADERRKAQRRLAGSGRPSRPRV